MTMFAALEAFGIHAVSRRASLACVLAFIALPVASQSIPPNLTQLRPIRCIAYDPKPSDFRQDAYFDSDFFNGDFTAIWGDDGQPGARNDLKTFADAKLNLLHLYDWNAQRVNHTSALDEAHAKGLKVMVPISNFTASTIVGETPGCQCPWGYQAAFKIVSGIFKQVYGEGTTPHPAVAMWGIYNEYDLNRVNPADVAFVAQAIITLEDAAGVPAANRLPMTAPVSDAIWYADARKGAMPRDMNAAFERAAQQWLVTNPGKNVTTPQPVQLPGAVLAILAIANSLSDGQTKTSYSSKFDVDGPANVSAIPADFWKTRWIASSNPFRDGKALVKYITSAEEFQSAFPGTTAFNTLPPLFFGEMGRSQKDTRPPPPGQNWDPATCDATCKNEQAAWVLDQIDSTAPLAANAASTPQGYFLGSCFFQHTLVDASRFEAFDTTGTFSPRPASPTAPFPASGHGWRVDALTPLPVWSSVTKGYAPALDQVDELDLAPGNPGAAVNP